MEAGDRFLRDSGRTDRGSMAISAGAEVSALTRQADPFVTTSPLLAVP
jgi:hypothetical protein